MISTISLIKAAAIHFAIAPSLLFGVCYTESHLRNTINVVDGKSASYGVCQLKGSTAASLTGSSVSPSQLLNIEFNLSLAAQYLRYQIARYPNDPNCVIAAYNAGSCIKINGQLINENYVIKVKRNMKLYEQFKTN